MPNNTVEYTEWVLLRRCNLSNIGGRVYVRVRVSVRVTFQHYLAPPRTRSPMFDRLQRRNNSHGLEYNADRH